jgi:hypothetical protein
MSVKWAWKKQAILRELQQTAARSRILSVLDVYDKPNEVQAVVEFQFATMVKDGNRDVSLAGPVVVGLRYGSHLLSEAPHPLELAAILAPAPFHPNCSPHGMLCLGHPTPGISLESVLHQVWAAITFNMKCVNVRPGEVMNREAADYVRLHPYRFPLTEDGLFEADPVSHQISSGTLARWFLNTVTP